MNTKQSMSFSNSPLVNKMKRKCLECGKLVDIIREKFNAEKKGVRELKCPHCGFEVGSLN